MALVSCPECHREISDKAPSCPHCGFPLMQQPEAPEDKWETCRIEWGVTSDFMGTPTSWSEHYFWAKAISPEGGAHSAGCSAKFTTGFKHKMLIRQNHDHRPPAWDGNATKAFVELADLLVGDGWESTPIQGNLWWQQSFRRRARLTEDGWLIAELVRKLDRDWCPVPVADVDNETLNDPELQEGLKNGGIRRESDTYWFSKPCLIRWVQGVGGQLVSEIPVGPDGSTQLAFKGDPAQNTGPDRGDNAKLCAVCGEPADKGDIRCPKCGSGVFNHSKNA